MSIWKKMGKAVGHAVTQASKKTAAAIKRKKLQNEVKRKILNRMKIEELKQLIKDNHLSDPPLPNRGYYKKEDYVKWAYRGIRFKKVLLWARNHNVRIKDIMEYYIAEMDKIDQEYGETKEEDEAQGVEDVKVNISDFEAPFSKEPTPPSQSLEDRKFEEILNKIEFEFGRIIKDLKITDEREFQNHLYIFLRGQYPEMDIYQHVEWNADLLLDGKYALELKYADNSGTLDKGVREVKDYKRHTKYVAVIMLDVGDLNPETIEKYSRYYQEDGAKVVILHGRGGRKKKRRGREIRIRM